MTGECLKKYKTDGYYNQNVSMSMAANKISYAFDLKGPSFICDTACSSSYYALVLALNDLRSGLTENAIVGATQVNFDSHATMEFLKVGMLSPDGICKSFSTRRDGYVRSEACVTFLLQKRKNCRRIYAQVVGGRVNADGYTKEGLNYPSMIAHFELMKDTFEQFKVKKEDVTYFEAHGTGRKSQWGKYLPYLSLYILFLKCDPPNYFKHIRIIFLIEYQNHI